MTPASERDAWWQGALNCCAVAVTIFFVIWVIMSPLRTPSCPAAPVPAPAETADALEERLTHQLCDREVDALLHSHELIEVERAVAIVARVNCGIERRL
jgi:hypothetical protein